jgi:hypothetical protein
MFRTQRGKFPHPNPHVASGKKAVPLIFELVPKFKADCLEYIYRNFDNFVVDMLKDKIIAKLLPKHVAEIGGRVSSGQLPQGCEEQTLFQRYTEVPLSHKVVLSWVKSIGFYRDSVKKSYYSDGHKKPEQKNHRSRHTHQYLAKMEPLCQRWISVTPSELALMNAKLDPYKSIINDGYEYEMEDGVAMIEFHVDDHSELQRWQKRSILVLVDVSVFEVIPVQNQSLCLVKMKPYTIKILSTQYNGYHLMVKDPYCQRIMGWGRWLRRCNLERDLAVESPKIS